MFLLCYFCYVLRLASATEIARLNKMLAHIIVDASHMLHSAKLVVRMHLYNAMCVCEWAYESFCSFAKCFSI